MVRGHNFWTSLNSADSQVAKLLQLLTTKNAVGFRKLHSWWAFCFSVSSEASGSFSGCHFWQHWSCRGFGVSSWFRNQTNAECLEVWGFPPIYSNYLEPQGQPSINGWFNWMIPIIYIYIENGCFTKHPFINGCLGFQVYVLLKVCFQYNFLFNGTFSVEWCVFLWKPMGS